MASFPASLDLRQRHKAESTLAPTVLTQKVHWKFSDYLVVRRGLSGKTPVMQWALGLGKIRITNQSKTILDRKVGARGVAHHTCNGSLRAKKNAATMHI